MYILRLSFFVVCGLGGVGWAAREADRITYLPGIDPQPTFKQYSGFLQATGTDKHFYWFVESENNPSTDPVVLWLNGGPGCSSLTGFLLELGPFRVEPNGRNLTYFAQRWNKIANIIFMESPAGVGFSHNDEGDFTTSDDETALNNHEALKDFFRGFPEYKNNDFFVAGESYAGVYVPTLASRLIKDDNFTFKGFAVGNPVTDRSIMSNSQTLFAYSRGLFDDDLWNQMLDECCVQRNASNCNFYNSTNEACTNLMRTRYRIVWRSGLNPYNVYADCHGGVPAANGIMDEDDTSVTMVPPELFIHNDQAYDEYMDLIEELSRRKEVKSRIPCTDSASRETYLNDNATREALHVPPHVHRWQICSSAVSRNYTRNYTDVTKFYEDVINANYYALLYSGDLDMACDHLGSSWFIDRLQRPGKQGYKHWTWVHPDTTNQIAGYVKQYEGLKFVSVKGAGHFVPTDKPQPAFDLFQRFINNEDY